MNNLLSYCGLVDARISASEKDLPVINSSKMCEQKVRKVVIEGMACQLPSS
jgi:hypothetical protein